MEQTLPPEILYSVYWYRSGTNQTMRSHLRGIAEEAAALVKKGHARVLDIGCNDGTLLSYYPTDFVKFGVDPSDVAQEIRGDVTVVRDLFPSGELANAIAGHPFDVITSIAMFYDLEDPVEFVEQIRTHLAPEGVWIFEMSHMPTMLKMCAYDTICHEHIEYYSVGVIEFILKKAGMKLVRSTLNGINGGSIRCYATHGGYFGLKSVEFERGLAELRKAEFDMALDTDSPYTDFQNRVNIHRHELTTLVRRLKGDGKTIHVYGASTKGNTMLQFCGLDGSVIDCAAERNPDKFGARTLGTNIPIVSEAESRANRPDYYLVLPWHFREEFLEREKELLNQHVGMIFPLPTVEIVRR
jgi:SAM-dependent methyltransferase